MSPPSRKRKADKRGDSEDMSSALKSMYLFEYAHTEPFLKVISWVYIAFENLSLGDFDKNISTTLPPINIDKNFTVVSQNISCSQIANAGFDVAVDTKVDAQATLGVVAQGSLIPPAVTEFALFAGMMPLFHLF